LIALHSNNTGRLITQIRRTSTIAKQRTVNLAADGQDSSSSRANIPTGREIGGVVPWECQALRLPRVRRYIDRSLWTRVLPFRLCIRAFRNNLGRIRCSVGQGCVLLCLVGQAFRAPLLPIFQRQPFLLHGRGVSILPRFRNRRRPFPRHLSALFVCGGGGRSVSPPVQFASQSADRRRPLCWTGRCGRAAVPPFGCSRRRVDSAPIAVPLRFTGARRRR
jgi:hypothetical protein